MNSKYFLRLISLLALLVSLIPAGSANALASMDLPPADMFQLPWEQGAAWVAYDGFDNGTKRLVNSPHNYHNGGAVDFAPHANMRLGEDTSQAWVTAAAAGTVVEISACHLKINHGNGWITEYQFLANIQVGLGEAVFRNQHLAVIANGTSQKFCPPAREPDIPHLHFSLRPEMRDALFSGWAINYAPLFNKTTFSRDGQTLGSFQPLLNTVALQIALRDAITWDTVYIGSVDASRYERWPFVLGATESFTLTVTPTTAGLDPVLLLLDANGNELARGSGTLTSTQPAGSYFVQVQPQAGSGFYHLLLQRSSQPVPSGPSVSTLVVPSSVHPGETAAVTVNLNDIPAEGYASAEFTCTYAPGLAEAGNIVTTGLFGADPAAAINGPQNGVFIVAIAGSNGSKAAAGGTAFTFGLTGLQVGQTAVECKARVSKGDHVLTDLPSTGASLTILASIPPPTSTPPPVGSPVPTVTPTGPSATPPSIPGDWLTFTNLKYGFEFKYPPEGQIVGGVSDNFAHINLPRQPGTNLGDKYLELVVAENTNPCRSPLATSSGLETSETVVINGISFLKETGGDATAGHVNTWTAYSTSHDIACVSLGFVLRAANPGNFSTPPPLFDEALEKAVFGQIVSTFTWLALPGTTPMPTSPVSGWPTFTDTRYAFEFKYPPEGQIAAGGSDSFTHINLPFVPGTNLQEKFLELLVAENANPCQSPLVTPLPPETVTINGLTFLKQTGSDSGVGHLHQWIAYSILRDNACVSLDFFLHSLNAGNFATPPVVFDYTAEAAVFEQIVSTFTWLGLPGPTPTPAPPADGTVTGQALASKPVTVTLYGAGGLPAATVNAAADGTFSFTAAPGMYTVIATASGYLSAQGSAIVSAGGTTAKPSVSLIAGDIDGNSVIDQFDAMTIGMSYNTAVPAAADLNNDGIINVLDLEILAANYRRSGALAWE